MDNLMRSQTATKRILIVDDHKNVRELLSMILQHHGHETEMAQDGFEALAKVKLDIDLVLLDLEMPGMDGFDVISAIRQDPEVGDVPICIITGNTGRHEQLRAVELGANDFIGKPVDEAELRIRANSLLQQKEAQDKIRRNEKSLEEKVRLQTDALRKSLTEIAEAQRKTYEAHVETLNRLALAAEYKDKDTARHIKRVSLICEYLGKTAKLPPREAEVLRLASPLHDVGKIGIPDAILLKPGKLTPEEYEAMKEHTLIGGRILDASCSELLETGKVIALSHHERWDGSGYPNGLKGEDIPLVGRICAIADVFDALATKRPYKEAYSYEKTVEMMREMRGGHFDPKLLDLFMDRLDEIIAIRNPYA